MPTMIVTGAPERGREAAPHGGRRLPGGGLALDGVRQGRAVATLRGDAGLLRGGVGDGLGGPRLFEEALGIRRAAVKLRRGLNARRVAAVSDAAGLERREDGGLGGIEQVRDGRLEWGAGGEEQG